MFNKPRGIDYQSQFIEALFFISAVLMFSWLSAVLMFSWYNMSRVAASAAPEQFAPGIETVRITKTSSTIFTIEATFVRLTSDKIEPKIETYGSFKRDPQIKEDLGYKAADSRRFTWTIPIEEWQAGGNAPTPAFKISATTVDRKGLPHKVSTPSLIYKNW